MNPKTLLKSAAPAAFAAPHRRRGPGADPDRPSRRHFAAPPPDVGRALSAQGVADAIAYINQTAASAARR